MSVAAAHAASFYREVAANLVIWAIRDRDGFPAPATVQGQRSMPFWSSESRAVKVTQNVAAYAGFAAVPIPWSEFRDRWVPGLTRDGCLAGVNWSGSEAMGYDVEPLQLQRHVEALLIAGA